MKTENLIPPSSKPHAVVEVFKTNVPDETSAFEISAELTKLFPEYKINFDLDDCDRILRVESASNIAALEVMQVVNNRGFQIVILHEEVSLPTKA